MNKFVVSVLMISVLIFSCNREENYNYEADTLAWCDSIYHRNVSCPKNGQVTVPPEVLAQEEVEHLAWCDSIYHRNISCPKHGQVEIPLAVLAEQEADHLAWCNQIKHQNVGCPGYKD
ncbi:MAG: hypothetical protein UU48_C0005G0011 [Candidatus Uhrbacteria bacterium GW2011_GWF2_41_16]|uniref:Lipoprotein n=2 Tax=Candidatus Uhriibacteriota TaxID=1752732 RepID=A0A0G0XMZ1_9BACT|nr:MAG: hypothetical protein UU31_C0001G0011 [Candidatus Uhrbacteria bacterium GW2011_GWA2_41_10]KKR87237.1 MAG: hypothetical protein UU35_C0004G0010 [Candidatus Uhrbacteria bacterium GW2011_GWC2_41_11]KKR98155.1 MAG: hypothetical protein UU48_C0005G0011 [Candidatus Uhrbacteria bacterium GW2011_GWF2_41_16]